MKKTVKKRCAIPSAHCDAPRLQQFAQRFLAALPPMDDTVVGAELLRGMVGKSMPAAKRRQLLAARIALLARENPQPIAELPKIVAAEPIAAPVPEPAPPPVVAKKKPPQSSMLSLDEAAQLFSAFSFGDPDETPSAAPEISMAPDLASGTPREIEVIEETLGSYVMETIETETGDPQTLEPTEIPKRKSAKGRGQAKPSARKKSRKTIVADNEPGTKPKPAVSETEDEPAKIDPAPVAPEAQRARRSGASRIISADSPASGKPIIDFSALASLTDDEPEPQPEKSTEAVFKPGLMINLSAADLLSSFPTDDDDDSEPKPD